MPTEPSLAALLLLGGVAGFLGGLLGVGGSVILIPGLTLLLGGGRQHLFQAAALIVNVLVVLPAVRQHLRVGAVMGSVVRGAAALSAAGAVAGVFASNRPVFVGAGQGYLQLLFGFFLIYVVCYNLSRIRKASPLPELSSAEVAGLPTWKVALLVGAPTGIVSGLLGIGGGAVAVPCQQVFLKIPLRRAIANSAVLILVSASVGAILKNATLSVHDVAPRDAGRLALLLAPTAMLGSLGGSILVHRLPRRMIRAFFVLFMSWAAWRMITAGWVQVSPLFVPGAPAPAYRMPAATKSSEMP